MRFRAHETFFIRKGWLSKGMKAVANDPEVFISKEINPMDVLGIGSNMVKSLRYWMQAVGITTEPKSGRRNQNFTSLGAQIYEHDKYVEEIGTLLLLQYELAKNYENATSWYFFFNEYNSPEFSKEDFVKALQEYTVMKGESVAVGSLEGDFNCIISTYLPKYKSSTKVSSPENNIDCPFGELGLIDIMNREKKTYRKAITAAASIDPWIALAVIMENANERTEISLNELLTAPCNIGKVFNLDVITMIDVLHGCEKLGVMKIIRTAGLDVVRINEQYSFDQCVHNYYESIGGR